MRSRIGRSIVVGHIYQLGTRYSGPLEATFVDEDGIEQPYQMGSYGIGISRIVAAAAEQFHDDEGLMWPKALAPFEVVVVARDTRDDEPIGRRGRAIYAELGERGMEVVLDDREERAGVKFADADLIGYPVQVVVGKRGVERGDGGPQGPGRPASGPRPRWRDAVERRREALLGTAP